MSESPGYGIELLQSASNCLCQWLNKIAYKKLEERSQNRFDTCNIRTRIIACLLCSEMLVCNIPSPIELADTAALLILQVTYPILYYPHTSMMPSLCVYGSYFPRTSFVSQLHWQPVFKYATSPCVTATPICFEVPICRCTTLSCPKTGNNATRYASRDNCHCSSPSWLCIHLQVALSQIRNNM